MRSFTYFFCLKYVLLSFKLQDDEPVVGPPAKRARVAIALDDVTEHALQRHLHGHGVLPVVRGWGCSLYI